MREWLKEIRNTRNMTQSVIASMSGVDVTTYNKIELNIRNPSTKTARSIANVLGFNWTRFFEPEQEAS